MFNYIAVGYLLVMIFVAYRLEQAALQLEAEGKLKKMRDGNYHATAVFLISLFWPVTLVVMTLLGTIHRLENRK